MTDGAVRRENLFAAIGLRQLGCLGLAWSSRSGFGWTRCAAERIEPVAAEISRKTPEIRAAEKDREAVDRNQPDGKRLEAGAGLALLALDGGVHLVDIRVFAVVHSLPNVAAGCALVHFFSSLAGAGDDAGAGEDAGAGAEFSLASFSSWDWSSDIK